MSVTKKVINQSKWPMHDPKMLIGGERVESESRKRLSSINPVNETVIGSVPQGLAEDVSFAVEAAEKAQPQWYVLSIDERAKYLREVARQLADRAEEILEVEVTDTGNTITKMRADVDKAIGKLEYFAGIGHELKGVSVRGSPNSIHFSMREPYGVVGGIAPFNHPNHVCGGSVWLLP